MNYSGPLRVGIGANLLAASAARVKLDGVGVYTREMAAAYSRRDDVDLVPVVMGRQPSEVTPPNSFVMAHPGRLSTALSWATGADFRGGARLSERIDVYHATDYRIPKLRRTPVCATLFDAIPLHHPEWANPHLRQLKNRMMRESAQWADHVIAISNAMIPELVSSYELDATRITVTHLGVDARWFEREPAMRIASAQSRYSLTPGYLLFVGTLQPRKNVDRIIAAFERLPAPIANGRQLVIAGKAGWRVEELVARLHGYAAGGRVRWLEYVDAEDMRSLFQGAAGFVFPSLHEGFGLPVLEAFASGVPVVTSNTTSLPEVAGDAAILIDPTDVDALAAAMESILDDSQMADRLRRAGLERARQFSWERCAAKTFGVLRSLA